MNDLFLLIVVALLLVLIGMVIGGKAQDANWRLDCAKHGVARYHPQTGAWEWTVPLVKESTP